MAKKSIDHLKDLINHVISDGKSKISAYINDGNSKGISKPINGTFLFYSNDNTFISSPKAPYYVNGVTVACRHNDYNKARNIAFDTLEYINVNRKTMSGVYWIPDTTPIYQGKDERTAGYWWTFDVLIKGGE